MCAMPRAPPPDSTRQMRGRTSAAIRREHGTRRLGRVNPWTTRGQRTGQSETYGEFPHDGEIV